MAHVAVLAWGLLSLSGPKPLLVADVEALPIDFVPIEEVSTAVQGEKKADPTDKPTPKPTERTDVVPEARNIGETDKDTRSQRLDDPQVKPSDTERADAPPPAPDTVPSPEVQPDPIKELVKETEPTPTPELAALDKPPVPVTQEEPAPQSEPAPSEEKFAELPKTAPVPVERPEPPKPRSAETRERKKPDDQPKPKQTAAKEDSKSTEDKIAALLNKEKPSSSGAKRSTDEASLGTRQKSSGAKLSQSEMDALRSQIQECWSPPAVVGAEELRVSVRFKLDPAGKVDGMPTISESSGNRAADESARRAVLKCGEQGYKLPAEKYEAWADVVVNFDPSQLF